ncbi:hypothetical protein [uncultured Amnibacterium sp.]|uniref:hypothetical protein n=1 Tax=uncultured Amnibacterium sp. TaxID=1631851 RepID=UPI0035CB9847
MTLITRRRVADVFVTSERHTGPIDVLFVVTVSLLLAVHLTIFVAVAALAPVTATEARNLALVPLPVEVARALVLPFHALLLGSLFVIGRRAAGRWAGFGAMLAVLALDLRSDPLDPVYGPPTAEGGWIAAALLAAGFALLPRRRLLVAALVGVASGFFAVSALALPAFLIGIALTPPEDLRAPRGRAIAAFAGVWAAAAALMQLLWVARLGPAGWAARAAEFVAEFRPHPLVPWLEQDRLLFASWHFPALMTFSLAMFLFITALIGVYRYFAIPQHGERGPAVLRVLRRFPAGLWAAGFTMIFSSMWWGLSGGGVFVLPNLPILAAATPLITAMAYRGAKWLLTVNRFWAVAAVIYLVGLILARTTQLVITLVQAFIY